MGNGKTTPADGPKLTKRRGPNVDKQAETRRVLVQAALATFMESGFAGTRMSDVAGRAGLAKGTLYLYFEDKAALFEGVLRELIGDAPAQLGQPGPDESTHTFLLRSVLPMVRALQASGRAGMIRMIASEGTRFPELAAVYHRVAIAPALEAIRGLGLRAQARGELGTDGLSRYPMILVAPVVLATLWNGTFVASPVDIGEVCEAFLALVFQAPATTGSANTPGS